MSVVRFFLLRSLFPCLLLFSLVSSVAVGQTAPAAPAAPTKDVELSPVIPTQAEQTRIAIPTFDVPQGQSGGQTPPEFMRDIIYRDLEWFGQFERIPNQQFIDQTHRRDERDNKINVREWQMLGGRLDFVLKGRYWIEGNMYTADCFLYDMNYGTKTFGRRYRNTDPRALAHQVSEDVIKFVFKDAVGITRTRILFVSQRGGLKNKEVFLMDADGQSQRQVTRDTRGASTPCWGKNGTEIYYTAYKDVNPDLLGFQLGTSQEWYISRRPGLNYSASWCPRSERIALTLGLNGNDEIYTMDRSGNTQSLKRLTQSAGIDTSPCWSPDGNRIVFNSSRTGYPQIYVMNADGGGTTQLTRQGNYNTSPAWSPKGDRIAFVARSGGTMDIYTMNPDGSDWRRLTQNQGNNEDPSWAPDGQHLAFVSNRSGDSQIYIMRADGTNQHQLTFEGNNQSPAWEPLTAR
jgi:TolB protein